MINKLLKKLPVLCVTVALLLSVSIVASAENDWLENGAPRSSLTPMWLSTSVTVPGTNGSGYSNNYVYKATNGTTASFKCTSKSVNRNFDARLINSNRQARSYWARNLDIDSVIYVNEKGATNGYQYTCEVSSDLFTIGEATVSLDFSPDYVQ